MQEKIKTKAESKMDIILMDFLKFCALDSNSKLCALNCFHNVVEICVFLPFTHNRSLQYATRLVGARGVAR